MADQTHGAVDSLVGLLSTAIKDEARLLGGVQGDIQFIKDEMESMNGFLLHLTKMESEHDDQLRAWMKQVREIAYIAQDCIELYMRDFTPPDRGFWGHLRHLVVLLWTMPARHSLATKIRELKVRVRDVGERRLRYDVNVPRAAELKQKQLAAGQDSSKPDVDRARDDFLRALARDKEQQEAPSFSHAISLLPPELASEAETIRANLESCVPDDHATRTICMEMLLRAFHAYPQVRRTKQDLAKLVEEAESAHLPKEVMVFCYSKLSTHYKSCLQYLSAFQEENSISRTNLVRRWVAEGLVNRQGHQTLEEAAEHCFNELLFRGFLLPRDTGAAGKVKSCVIHRPFVWSFVLDISKSENFVSHLPTHLDNQLRIRGIIKWQQERQQNRREEDSSGGPRSICGFCPPSKPRDDMAPAAAGGKDPMDGMVEFLKSLPLTYRLNVLDLGGCRGLKKSHLKSICKVLWLKYLSLRNTDVSRLPKQINKLKLLETLDIRQTDVQSTDTEHIFLPKLKHLLAGPTSGGAAARSTEEKEPLCTARMPRRIGMMRSMEILSHFQVPHGDAAQLDEVGRLQQLRKLGVVLGGSEESKDNIKHLLRAITKLSDCLRSLSIWITPPPANGEGVEMNIEEVAPHGPHPVSLESLNVSGLGNAGLPAAWIQKLERLSKITLCETSLSNQSLQDLGKQLHGLRCLRLRRNSYSERKLAFNKDGFKALKFLVIEGSTITSIAFEEDGAAPMLEKIVWRMSLNGMDMTTDTLSGIDHLPRLKAVELKGDFSCDTQTLEDTIAAHPNRPTLKRVPGTIIIEGPDDSTCN